MTLVLDEKVIDQARRLTGTHDVSALVNKALEALIASESARRLAALGGSAPDMESIPRRRSKAEE